jgi:hypothetical protein
MSNSEITQTQSVRTTNTNKITEHKTAKNTRDEAVIAQIDRVNVHVKNASKGLAVLAKEVLKSLNEILKQDLPEGVYGLKPENHTPEATAQRIVDGTTALFSVFAKQNPNLEGEELIDKFMSTIRGGIEKGYNEAVGILEAIDAFQIDGVESGIQETMRLVDEKLLAFEESMKASLKV